MPAPVAALLRVQCGVITRLQCERHQVTLARQRSLLRSGHWRRLQPGVYVTYTGRLQDESRVWAAVLAAGSGAAASHQAALWLQDRKGWLGAVVDIAVPERRRVTTPQGVRLHRRARLVAHGRPARVVTEAAALDVAARSASAREVIDVMTRVVGGRLAEPARIIDELARRRAHRWRGLLADMLGDVALGAHSPLELMDVRNDRAHGLPAGHRQVLHRAGGQGRWLDVVIDGPPGRGLVVVKELDGRLGHEGAARFRDMRRDNASTLAGGRALRFGWADEVDAPCDTAAMQALLWRRLGVAGVGHGCRRLGCRFEDRVAWLDREHPRLAAG